MRSPRTETKSSPRSLQLGKACAQKRRPNTDKNKIYEKKFTIQWFLVYSQSYATIIMYLLPHIPHQHTPNCLDYRPHGDNIICIK